ncbi:MAG TPA: hypothetical protein VD766_01885 [Solirubrobacterales bacterium]|nr:hypothetical protein [Solirubrobacterales bacterium]
MSPSRRIFGLALIALAVPFPALALDGGGAPDSQGAQTLTVTASLDSCGLAGSQVLCKIDAGWNALEGAETYTVSVTSPNGSVVDQGETSGQGSSVWVAYVGPGTYSVTVTAYGTPPGEEDDGEPEVIARESSKSGGISSEAAKTPPATLAPGESRTSGVADASEDPVVADGALPEDPREEPPICEEPPVDDEPATLPEVEDGTSDGVPPPPPDVVDTIPGDDDCPG